MSPLNAKISSALRPKAVKPRRTHPGGVLREAAEQLKQQAENAALTPLERCRAEDALVQLYLLTRDNRGEAA